MFYNSPKNKHSCFAIYRGAGGAGDAVNDSSSEASAAVIAQAAAEAAAIAAEAAKVAAQLAETNAETAETNAETAETNAETAASNALTSANNASNSAVSAASSASAASTSATNAASSASSASTSASAASTSASNASTSATNAASSASAAQSAQTSAEAARDAALSAYDNFDDRYLGAKSSDPTLDNDGNALVSGALYFNTTSGVMKVYNGSSWVAAYVSAAGVLLATNNLSDLSSVSTARTNLGLGTAATTNSTAYATAAQGAKADTALQPAAIGVTVQGYDVDTAKLDVSQSWSAAQSFNGGATLGDASGDALTINSSAVSIPNGLNFDSNTLVIDATNNRVGVNTASPSNPLEVVGSYISIKRAGAVAGYSITDTTAAKSAFYQYTQGSSLFIGAEGSTPIVFANTDALTERMRIDSSGNVGIGTSSPSYKLDVAGDIALKTNATYLYGKTSGGSATRMLGINSANDLYFGSVDAAVASIIFSNNGTNQLILNSSGNLGLGVTPSAWTGGVKAIQVSDGGFFGAAGQYLYIGANANFDTSWKYIKSASATRYDQDSGVHKWYNAPSGTAGNAITFTQAMTLDASGNLAVGTTTALTTASNRGNITVNGSGSAIYTLGVGGSSMGWFYSDTTNTVINSVGGGTAKPLVFETKTSNGESMRIDSSGNVGIGTTNIGAKLTVDSTTAGLMASFNSTATNGGYITGYSSGTAVWDIGTAKQAFNTGTSTDFGIATRSGFLGFGTASTERMRIDSSGNTLFAKAVRATVTTQTSLSHDMNAASNFKCTPSAGGALTFTNITSGQTGNIILVNGSNYAITAAATTKVSATCLATISATGTYWLSYYSDGTNVYVANTGALA